MTEPGTEKETKRKLMSLRGEQGLSACKRVITLQCKQDDTARNGLVQNLLEAGRVTCTPNMEMISQPSQQNIEREITSKKKRELYKHCIPFDSALVGNGLPALVLAAV